MYIKSILAGNKENINQINLCPKSHQLLAKRLRPTNTFKTFLLHSSSFILLHNIQYQHRSTSMYFDQKYTNGQKRFIKQVQVQHFFSRIPLSRKPKLMKKHNLPLLEPLTSHNAINLFQIPNEQSRPWMHFCQRVYIKSNLKKK